MRSPRAEQTDSPRLLRGQNRKPVRKVSVERKLEYIVAVLLQAEPFLQFHDRHLRLIWSKQRLPRGFKLAQQLVLRETYWREDQRLCSQRDWRWRPLLWSEFSVWLDLSEFDFLHFLLVCVYFFLEVLDLLFEGKVVVSVVFDIPLHSLVRIKLMIILPVQSSLQIYHSDVVFTERRIRAAVI